MSRRSRPVPEGIRITKVGLWYVLFCVVVAVAATNTGNNSLYLVLALMLGLLVASGIASRQNVRGLAVELTAPAEVYAQQPFSLEVRMANRGWLLPRWFLLVSVSASGSPWFLPFLPRGGEETGRLETLLPRRGEHVLRAVHVTSLYPFGFFQKGIRHRMEQEILVFPEIFDAAAPLPDGEGPEGEDPSRRRGRGHDLHSLREFRHGDDPRGIHWKQTARTGDRVYMEREADRSHRLSILLDNATGDLDLEADRERFERLVSEAATAAVDYLGRDYQVELVTRDGRIPFGSGLRQRLTILETLARLEPVPAAVHPLEPSAPQAACLRLRLEGTTPLPKAVPA